ncbi:MAG: hypothetical protein ACOYOD_15185, partial [Saprospiraceae bacterium]
VAKACWLNIPEHFPNAILYEHIVMPNYVHGIIEFVGANHYSPANGFPANALPETRANNDSPLLPDTKLPKDIPQQVFDADFAGDLA